MTRRVFDRCTVPGCKVVGGDYPWFHEHKRAVHVTCICGWVGVGFAQHRGQRARRGDAGAHYPVHPAPPSPVTDRRDIVDTIRPYMEDMTRRLAEQREALCRTAYELTAPEYRDRLHIISGQDYRGGIDVAMEPVPGGNSMRMTVRCDDVVACKIRLSDWDDLARRHEVE